MEQHQDLKFRPDTRFWVPNDTLNWQSSFKWALGFRDTTNVNNWRSVIAAVVPKLGYGNTLPLLHPSNGSVTIDVYTRAAVALAANLNSFVVDFVARQKIQARHLNLFILEQLPLVAPETYDRERVGYKAVWDLVRPEVLQLTYTAEDLRCFAEDLGYDGDPFEWDEEDRRHRRARLDAIYFRLYGLGEDDAAYILDTFPIVREQDEAAFGKYRTKEMILAYMRAFDAGDAESRVAV